ncbi:heme biosynthesis HemY N-terminal domain-containing protein [uncultured Rhodoblastus sp.]|uniref:heme biosynthesis protein HemY n=1 Tax=uncultured Rhodoblastus sp. TaxID=543037 RepID=UPI0025E02A91|nr:heme biosynthesis HemY N-terminal domain-containing protein [uncultured Rhodoblastus sp.]
MVRILIFLFVIAAAALGLGILVEQPGSLTMTWFGYHIDTSPVVGLSVIALGAIFGWGLVRFLFGLPGLVSLTTRARKRQRGHEALTRGILAAGVGDARKAQKASQEARKLLPHEPLTLLLEAQAAQLAGDRAGAERIFRAMTERPDTKLLGLRGLHAESLRHGDHDDAHEIALAAQKLTPLAWSGQAVFDRHTAKGDWEAARLCLEQNLRAKILDPVAARRQKAVLDTAIAMECELSDPERAAKLLRAAVKKAPELVPATALLARLLARRGDRRGAAKLIESAYARTAHPDLAEVYIDVRPGDSSGDRLDRARRLAKFAPGEPESAIMLAQAALGARDFAAARAAMSPLIAEGKQPTSRMCLIMAEIEHREKDAEGLVREWLSRGSRAPRDAAWVADGHWSRKWAPVSPVTGKLDAFSWVQPREALSGPVVEPAPDFAPPPALSAAGTVPTETPQLEAAKIETPPAEILPGASAEPAPPNASNMQSPQRQPTTAQPVIFPQPSPPDDPGPKRAAAEIRPF